jgi:hypothetical protein
MGQKPVKIRNGFLNDDIDGHIEKLVVQTFEKRGGHNGITQLGRQSNEDIHRNYLYNFEERQKRE